MPRFGVLLIAMTVLLAPACADERADDEVANSTTTSTTLPVGDPDTADLLVLHPDGVALVHEDSSQVKLSFGQDAAEVEAQLRTVLGEPGTEAPVIDCSAGVQPQQSVWPGFVMLKLDGKFAGWAARDGTHTAVLERGQRLTIGSPLVLVEEYLGPLDLAQSPRGFEFVLGDGAVTTYAGAFPSKEDTAPLIAFSAGLTCFAR